MGDTNRKVGNYSLYVIRQSLSSEVRVRLGLAHVPSRSLLPKVTLSENVVFRGSRPANVTYDIRTYEKSHARGEALIGNRVVRLR
ncbi:MAG: hypothetical protein CMJ64_00350 [Planctomycetaceae bacterium]|nr:hypothetical protein [Planctomycetaceae bacterium]